MIAIPHGDGAREPLLLLSASWQKLKVAGVSFQGVGNTITGEVYDF
jgi:hypothetical protein